jgi:hypothetical protein
MAWILPVVVDRFAANILGFSSYGGKEIAAALPDWERKPRIGWIAVSAEAPGLVIC